jgi:hypothetical protein
MIVIGIGMSILLLLAIALVRVYIAYRRRSMVEAMALAVAAPIATPIPSWTPSSNLSPSAYENYKEQTSTDTMLMQDPIPSDGVDDAFTMPNSTDDVSDPLMEAIIRQAQMGLFFLHAPDRADPDSGIGNT